MEGPVFADLLVSSRTISIGQVAAMGGTGMWLRLFSLQISKFQWLPTESQCPSYSTDICKGKKQKEKKDTASMARTFGTSCQSLTLTASSHDTSVTQQHNTVGG